MFSRLRVILVKSEIRSNGRLAQNLADLVISELVQVAMTNAEETSESGSKLSVEPDASMQEYYQLQQELLLTTIAATVVIFVTVCFFYPLNIALNYLLGAAVSVVYLRMLGKDVERIGRERGKLSQNRLAVFAGLIIVATQWEQLEILPIFLGFLTYKVAFIIYVLRTTLMPNPK